MLQLRYGGWGEQIKVGGGGTQSAKEAALPSICPMLVEEQFAAVARSQKGARREKSVVQLAKAMLEADKRRLVPEDPLLDDRADCWRVDLEEGEQAYVADTRCGAKVSWRTAKHYAGIFPLAVGFEGCPKWKSELHIASARRLRGKECMGGGKIRRGGGKM